MQWLAPCSTPWNPWLNQDGSNSSVLAMELLQSCTKPLKWWLDNKLQGHIFIKTKLETINNFVNSVIKNRSTILQMNTSGISLSQNKQQSVVNVCSRCFQVIWILNMNVIEKSLFFFHVLWEIPGDLTWMYCLGCQCVNVIHQDEVNTSFWSSGTAS